MASKKYFVDIDLQSNKVDNLKADTLDITTNLASANTKRIVYWSGVYYYSDGTNWVAMNGSGGGGLPIGGTAGQILAKIDAVDYHTEWIDNYTSTVKHEVKAAENISKGQAVYVSGSTGGSGTNMIVSKASNTSEATSSKTMGLVVDNVLTNGFVFVVTEGLLAGLDTSAANAVGDPVWLGTNGNLLFGVANKPYAPAHMVFIGIVTRVQSVNGEIFVKVQNGFELDELHNVSAQSPANNDGIFYNTTTSLWEKKSIATALGYTPENIANKSTDTNLGTSNTLYPTQNAVKVYADSLLGNANALVYKGVIDCSTNPNYLAADAGFMYIASVAGKIGGASGIEVEVGDMIICNTDGTISGNQATVGLYWNIIQKNIVGAVTGPASSVNNNVAFFDGVTGKIIKDSGLGLSGTNTGDETQTSIKTKLGSASSSTDGYLSSTDWTTFNSKIGGSGTINEIAYFTASGSIASLTTGTYPSLTELSYVKGVTSSIQTQIDNTYIARIQSVVSASTVTPTFANDEVIITAQAVNLTLANPTGTAAEGKTLIIRIKDNGTTRGITFDTQYRAINVVLPTSTTASRTLYIAMIYNATDTRWDVTGVGLENANPDNTVQLLYYSNNC